MSLKWTYPLDFSECLKRSWQAAKEAARVFTVDMDDLTVTGNTFPVRKLMRELGLDWDAKAKAWTGRREALNALCVKYA